MNTKETLARLEACESEAIANPGKAIRIVAGYYFIQTPRGLVEIDRIQAKRDDTGWDGWVSRCHRGRWASDPVPTLAEAIEQAMA